MDPISPPLSTTSAIGDDKSDLSCPKRKNVMECHICFEPPTDPVAASCGHVFCWPCVYKWLRDRPNPSCPVCRHSLRTDRNIIPLYGGGVGAGPSNGNKGSVAESPTASDMAIPPRPSNPLLVRGTASMEDSTHVRPATGDITGTVDSRYMRLIREHSTALLTRVRNLETERANSERERSDLEHMIADLRRQVEEKDHRIFELERNRMMPGVHDLQKRNFALVQEVQENQARESWHIERGNQMGEEIARLQQQLDRANCMLSAGRSGGA